MHFSACTSHLGGVKVKSGQGKKISRERADVRRGHQEKEMPRARDVKKTGGEEKMMSHEGKEGRDRKRKICQTTEMLRDGLFNPHGLVTSYWHSLSFALYVFYL